MAVRCEICGEPACGCMSDPRAVELVLALRLARGRRLAFGRRAWFGAVAMGSCAVIGFALASIGEPVLQALGGILCTFGVGSAAVVTMASLISRLQATRELRRLRSRQALPAARVLS